MNVTISASPKGLMLPPGHRFNSPVLTGVMMPDGVDADAVRKIVYERFDCSLGTGLGEVRGADVPHRLPGDCNVGNANAARGSQIRHPEDVHADSNLG